MKKYMFIDTTTADFALILVSLSCFVYVTMCAYENMQRAMNRNEKLSTNDL